MNTVAKLDRHDILMKYKSKAQKDNAINELIDIILSGKLDPDELEEAKQEAVILAESNLRCDTKKQKKSRKNS